MIKPRINATVSVVGIEKLTGNGPFALLVGEKDKPPMVQFLRKNDAASMRPVMTLARSLSRGAGREVVIRIATKS